MKLLVLPDIHQNVKWASAVLEREADKVDRIVFLGDFFDSSNPDRATVVETSEFLENVRNAFTGKVDFLKGNHDISYYFFYEKAKQFKSIRPYDCPYACTGFTKSKCYRIAKTLSREFVKDTKLAVSYDDVIYTHAGVRMELFSYRPSGYDVAGFLKEADDVNTNFKNPTYFTHRFLGCGRARGGFEDFGGLTWCDFNDEFYASEGLPVQIFGHTKQKGIPTRKGQNWCIDCVQTCYALVYDGVPEFRFIKT